MALPLLFARAALAVPFFPTQTAYSVDGGPVGVVTGDVDAQSEVDLVSANEAGEDGPSLSFLLNHGDGSFAPEERLDLSAGRYILHALASADFNGDGVADLAVAVDDISVFPSRTTVLIYRNDGVGQYLDPVAYALGGFFPQFIRAADVNGDGVLDLVVCHSRSDTGQGVVSVLLGQGTSAAPTGSFALASETSVGTSPTTVAIADVDGDGHADLLVGDPDEGAVFVLYGNAGPGLIDPPLKLV
ncbi:MAG TPA: VCBS repeat-containing protein, partial [Candidatus Kryptonia bacterium]|nr:VCBS repeat-containing protein [Candidatus Kryptonia bacterium]